MGAEKVPMVGGGAARSCEEITRSSLNRMKMDSSAPHKILRELEREIGGAWNAARQTFLFCQLIILIFAVVIFPINLDRMGGVGYLIGILALEIVAVLFGLLAFGLAYSHEQQERGS